MTLILPPDVSPWISIGAPFLSGIAGATLGGTVTWLTAGRKLARERAAERTLEWLEGMHDALVCVMLPLGRGFAQLLQAQPDYTIVSASLIEVGEALESAQAFRHRARLFASPTAVAAIRDAFDKLEDPIAMPHLTGTYQTSCNGTVRGHRQRADDRS